MVFNKQTQFPLPSQRRKRIYKGLLRLQTKTQVSANEVSLVFSFFTIYDCKSRKNIYIAQYLLLVKLHNPHFLVGETRSPLSS